MAAKALIIAALLGPVVASLQPTSAPISHLPPPIAVGACVLIDETDPPAVIYDRSGTWIRDERLISSGHPLNRLEKKSVWINLANARSVRVLDGPDAVQLCGGGK